MELEEPIVLLTAKKGLHSPLPSSITHYNKIKNLKKNKKNQKFPVAFCRLLQINFCSHTLY